MKKIITLTILILTSTLVQMISFIPWWSFIIPIFALGVVLPLEKWKISPFLSGFFAGLLVWVLSTVYFDVIYKGEIMIKISKLMYVTYYLMYIIIGMIGGILTGLAFYSGFSLRRGKELLRLETKNNIS